MTHYISVKNKIHIKNKFSAILSLFVLTLIACGGGGGSDDTPPPQPDVIPDSFSFTPVSTASLSTLVESNSITVSGIDAATTISVSNGEYRIDSGSFTNSLGTINNGQSVVVRAESAASVGVAVTATLTIGGVSADFVVTTISNAPILTRLANSSCIAPAQANTGNSSFDLEAVFTGLPSLSRLVGLYQSPNDSSRWYAMQQSGEVFWFDNNSGANTLNDFINLSSIVRDDGERGLLGFAFHPQYAVNGEFYVSYINQARDSVISRFVNNGNLPVSLAGEEVILTLDQPAENHNGGNIAFGPDGYLYIGFGDGGGSGDDFGNGQNTQTLHSTILRINVDGTDTYTIPADNPFVNDNQVLDEIYAYGFRNPWRWSFDMQTGELWLGDVGQGQYEEVDIVHAGENFGWPIMEGNHCFQSNNCDQTGLVLPVAEYNHNQGDCSISGGFVYRGQRVSALQGHYLYGDFCTGRIFSTVKTDNQTYATQEIELTGMGIASFAQDLSGEVYVLNYSGSAGEAVYRFVDSNGGTNNIPTNLSDSGCFESTANKSYTQGVVPYSVTSQLWSDGVAKSRLFAVPDDSNIDVLSDGDFDFPEGTILIKNFILDNQYLETRLFMRHVSGWGGYSYKWLDDQSDAVLVEGADSVTVGNFEHIIPSRGQCFECHTSGAGILLGPEASQLNFDFQYPNGNSGNQLQALSEAGYLSSLPTGEQIAPLASIDDSAASTELKARSYLHSNCSNCHRPGGTAPQLDLRIRTSLSNTQACDQAPNNGDLGIANARIIAPGESARSVLLARVSSLNAEHRMPPLATQVVDAQAVEVIENWINGLTGCE
ncbi:PQQ-dependent sugar dehydrogenase [Aliikangiella coralliicola]|uniref:Glucose/Sorbosone dehydrogenase domain-containing protein n=1 Tax=Aliikangiella coralliicola TaxID=2592383 RepID=A0A545TS11_9GAMM|nr:PQQ-dependent sugar dehydrogenase [Aliikangiella coralliicola]TQV80005.1 hypothetical protein FLL46_26720 [Aliikangiella coralliicola]